MAVEGWKLSQVGEHVKFEGGSQPPRDTFVFSSREGYVRLIQIRDYKSDKYATYIPAELARRNCEKDDVMIGRYGPPIFQILRGLKGAYNVALIKAIPNTNLDKEYLYYFLSQEPLFKLIEHLSQRSSGQTGVDMEALRNYKLPLPPLGEQRQIVAILNSVDEAIASTQAVIDQTRKVKQGLLQQLLTRGIGHTRFKESAIGRIPENWEVVELKQLLSKAIQNGYSPVCPKDPTGHWILSLGAVSPDGLALASVKPAPINDLKVFEFSLEPGDFLISRSNTRERVGFSALFRGEIENCSYPDLLMRFRINNNMMVNDFLEIYLSSSTALEYLQNAAAGTSSSMVKITKSVVEKLPVPIPPISEQQQICEAIQEIQKAAKYAHQGLERLMKTKSGLMQDLLTGKVRVGCTS